MAHAFQLLDILVVLLAGSAAAFMVWVFWSLNQQIRREVRTRVTPRETTWTPEPAQDHERLKEHVFDSAEASLWTPEKVATITRRAQVKRFERRVASRA